MIDNSSNENSSLLKKNIEDNINTNKIYGYLLSFFGVFVLTFDTLLIRLASININDWQLIFYRFLFYFLGSFFFNLFKEKSKFLYEIHNLGFQGILISSLISLCNITFTLSINYTSVSNSLAIYSISPIFTSLISWILFKEKIKLYTFFILLLVISTVLFVILYDVKNNDNYNKNNKKNKILNLNDNEFGCILSFISMISTAGYFTLFRYNQLKHNDKKIILTIFISGFL